MKGSNGRGVRLRVALPKGRMQAGVCSLLEGAGIGVWVSERDYRPVLGLEGAEAKLLKPQNVVEMLSSGSRDVGFAGRDWVEELGADVVEVLDTGLDPVRLVAAAPESVVSGGGLERGGLVVASEYARLARGWIEGRGLDARLVRTYGATEAFPPEDADCIVDVTATGATLRAQRLVVVDELMRSSTRLYASRAAMGCAERRGMIERLAMVLRSVLEARERVMVEVNVSEGDLSRVVAALPCMREATVSPLAHGGGYAVKAAVVRRELARVIPEVKARGGTDIVVTRIEQIVP